MRILFLSPVGFLGGAERVLLDVMASLRPVLPPGSSMRLICLSEGELLNEARAIGVEAEVMPLPPPLASLGDSGLSGERRIAKMTMLLFRLVLAIPSGMAYVSRIRKAVAAVDADIIHSNGAKTHLLSRFIGARGRVVWHIHDLLGGGALLSRALRYADGKLAAAIAISQAVANDLQQVLPGAAVYTVLNGIDIEHFSPGPADPTLLDRLAGMTPAPDGTVRVGLVATYARWKGQDLFLKAAAKLKDAPARFYIIGGSIYHTAGSQFSREELESSATALGLAGKIGFIGFQKETLDVYRALDVMVHASTKPEPFGRTIAEAMACGRAVIVSNAGGAAELFEHAHDAMGVAPGDADALAAAMRSLIINRQQREALGTAAHQTAVERFGRARLGAEFLAIYRRVLG